MAATIEHNKPDDKGTQQLFKNPILEKLTRTHISIPLILFTVISTGLIYYGNQLTELTWWQYIAGFVAGALLFSWIEYSIHKHVFHMEPTSKFKENIQYKFHGVHHDYPKDKDRLAMPPLVSVVLATLLFYLFRALMGDFVFAFLPGVLMGYVAYLGVHYIVHAYRPPNNLFKALWVNHGIHHYKSPDKAFGVSSPLWDYIYRTMP